MPLVADAMVTDAKLSRADVTVRELRVLFANDHVHAAVIVEDGRLLAVVDRADLDLRPDDARAVVFGGLAGRVVAASADVDEARQGLLASGRRRLAAVDDAGRFLGLLCLKRSRRGFCSDRDLAARSAERVAVATGG